MHHNWKFHNQLRCDEIHVDAIYCAIYRKIRARGISTTINNDYIVVVAMKVRKVSYDISLLRSDKVIHAHNLTSSDRQQVINQLFSIYMCTIVNYTESIRTIAVLFDSAKLLRSMTLCTCIVTSTSRETLRAPGTSKRAPAGSALVHAGCYTANPDQTY